MIINVLKLFHTCSSAMTPPPLTPTTMYFSLLRKEGGARLPCREWREGQFQAQKTEINKG